MENMGGNIWESRRCFAEDIWNDAFGVGYV